MTISTFDGVLAGCQPPRLVNKVATSALVSGRPVSLWPLAGIPGPGSYDTTLNGLALNGGPALSNNIAGQIPFVDPGSGVSYLDRFTAQMTILGQVMLLDRIWHNGGIVITSTGAQTIVSPAWPNRDVDGAALGNGVLLAVEVSAAVGAGTPTITVSYTNQAGVAGRTGTNTLATVASAPAGTMYLIGLQAGDTGVQSVQSITLSATWTSGTINLVAYRILAILEQSVSGGCGALDIITSGFPKCYNGTVAYLAIVPGSATAATLIASTLFTQG